MNKRKKYVLIRKLIFRDKILRFFFLNVEKSTDVERISFSSSFNFCILSKFSESLIIFLEVLTICN